VSYLGTEKVVKVYDALRVAYRAHRGQARKSGEPFIIHPVEVSLLLAGLKMDGDTVMAGLLHDTVEDTDLTFELIEEMFGETVRAIVEGETKVSKLPKLAFSDYADEQAENLRQMFVAMTDDYRIIIVKLADRLHNMRTLRFMKPEKQVKISRETLDIFAPLAHRMGIWQFKSELEDTAFMYLYPQEYKRLSRRLHQHQKKFQETLDKSKKMLKERLLADPTLRDQAVSVKVSGRMKEIYSLWHKMETKGERNLDHILDVVALRVIITPKKNREDDENDSDRGVWLCYHVLGLVQHLDGFQPVPTRVKDYISFPKPNGYQSLHTALILNGQKIEVQIRTSMMHQVAEYGMASHWAYTDEKRRQTEKGDVYNTPWLSSIKEWQNEKLNARDFVDSVRSELLGKRVFVFLRNGKILNLARGATAIDAAFQIHTEVGLNMHGVEVNGKPVPISYELQNGDVVSILTGEGKPSTEWMRYAKSRSTRSKLRSYFRSQQKER
jgi:GTP pyrophosphokinase